METIKIATQFPGKKVPVEGFRVGAGLAVTQVLNWSGVVSGWWSVIHVPTGRIIGDICSTKAAAKRIAMALLKVADTHGFVWGDLKTVKQVLALPKEALITIKAIDHEGGIEIGMGVKT